MSRSVAKGKQAERDIVGLVQAACDIAFGNGTVEVGRTGYTAAGEHGGSDISGVPWLAVEVKHHARATPAKEREWWTQCCRQAAARPGKPAQVPLLAAKENNRPWRFTLVARVWCAGGLRPMRVTVGEEDVLAWLIAELRARGPG